MSQPTQYGPKLHDYSVSLFESGVESPNVAEKKQHFSNDDELLTLGFAYELGFKGCFPSLHSTFIKAELGGVEFFKQQKNQTFLVLFKDEEFAFAIEIIKMDLPIVGINKKEYSEQSPEIHDSAFPMETLDAPMLYKRTVTKQLIKTMFHYLKPYRDEAEQGSDDYRGNWALNNIGVVQELSKHMGDTVFISLDHSYNQGVDEMMEKSGTKTHLIDRMLPAFSLTDSDSQQIYFSDIYVHVA